MRDLPIARRTLLGLLAAGLPWCAPEAFGAQSGRRAHAARVAPPAFRPRVVAIDPGHGGVDPGAISRHGAYEKKIVLATALDLAAELNRLGRYRVVLTRRADVLVPLRERVARARAQRAELLLSIHADALPDSELRGLSVYTLSERASDRETAALAQRENRDDFVGGVRLSRQPRDIGNILLDLARRDTNNRSLVLARAVVDELGHMVPLLDRPHRAAAFAVLTAPDVPSVLVELGCLSNPAEERLLTHQSHRRLLAHGLARSVEAYFAAHRV
jgi:N-acetylmuramoyl-L-alanine amidase